MNFQQAYSFISEKLKTELPSYITYHTWEHTENVIRSAEELAKTENISGDDLILLKTAALFHDTGFLHHHQEHEEESCKIARKYLPEYGYNETQIEHICRLIMATRLPQLSEDHLASALCDADLYYLGTNNYTEYAERLYQESKKTNVVSNDTEWLMKQIEFLSAHTYFTRTAQDKLTSQKLATLAALQARLQHTKLHKESPLQRIQDALLAIVGVTIAGIALKLFLVPNHFFDGGVTGISLLVHELYHYNLGVVILFFNLPLIVLGYFSVGQKFAVRTLLCVILLGVCLSIIPDHSVTADKLLISIFGGAFLGIGIGLIMRVGAALDGIEVLALYALKKTSFTITEIILAFNILIFTIAAFNFGIETALYSILTYFTATRCINYVVEGLQAYTGVTIVSAKSEVIKFQLVNKLGRGITIYKGERGFLPGKYEISSDCDIIFTIITRLEFRKLKNLVYDIDPKAFIFTNEIKDASGGIIKRRGH
ncbi:YitT family protein [Terrimonas sp. NA20]|uniref:YitT family protein n=1 Tax=Terrimonas ginsenosidimutans TaxID=2908004 RepID=A0ABS9KLT6_9BACT|nr:YitT family protein [Terrimonas ginsenosidimutans]MCG2613278.1 YitT family protein [Terrimonas ginsenosidimutans]